MEAIDSFLQIQEIVLNKRFSREQLECTYSRAKEVLEIVKDFEINSKDFKEYEMEFEFMHFVFIDKRSLWRIPVSIQDFGHDLYYLIIVCNTKQLSEFNFDHGNVFCVDDKGNMISLQMNKELYTSFRGEFLKGIGQDIRTSTVSNITEYIYFKKDVVNVFRKEMNHTDNPMIIKLICIFEKCAGTDNDVVTHLSNPENQNRLSLAFQQNADLVNENFYDVGNMQP